MGSPSGRASSAASFARAITRTGPTALGSSVSCAAMSSMPTPESASRSARACVGSSSSSARDRRMVASCRCLVGGTQVGGTRFRPVPSERDLWGVLRRARRGADVHPRHDAKRVAWCRRRRRARRREDPPCASRSRRDGSGAGVGVGGRDAVIDTDPFRRAVPPPRRRGRGRIRRPPAPSTPDRYATGGTRERSPARARRRRRAVARSGQRRGAASAGRQPQGAGTRHRPKR